ASALCEARRLPKAHGLAIQVDVVRRLGFQSRLRRVVHARGDGREEGVLQLQGAIPWPLGTRGAQRLLQRPNGRRVPHLLVLRPRKRDAGQSLPLPRPGPERTRRGWAWTFLGTPARRVRSPQVVREVQPQSLETSSPSIARRRD